MIDYIIEHTVLDYTCVNTIEWSLVIIIYILNNYILHGIKINYHLAIQNN